MKRALFILLIAVFHPALLSAEEAAGASDPVAIRILAGRSAIIDTGSAITRVSLTSAEIADALVTSSTQLLVHGKA